MTDVLRETLEERGRARAWGDVESLVAAGDRRVRRRRVTGAVAGVAAVAALALATPYVVGALGRDDAQVATQSPFDVSQPSWVDGSVLHVGGDTLALDSYPQAYVLTDDAAVVTAADGTVELYDGGAEPTEIGTIGEPGFAELVADGSLVAWYDGDAEQAIVYDTAARQEQLRVAASPRVGAPYPAVEALDGDSLWWSVGGRIRSTDVATGGEFGVVPRESVRDVVVDAAGGRVATYARDEGVTVRSASAAKVLGRLPARFDDGLLSPDGTLMVSAGTSADLVIDRIGERTSRQILSLPDGVGVTRWLDDRRFQAVGGTGTPTVLVCSVASLACDPVATDVPASELVVPDGTAAHSYR